MKQASRNFYLHISSHIISMGFVQSKCDPCLYHKRQGEKYSYILLYVDDILLISPSIETIHSMKKSFKEKYVLEDQGPIDYYLGMTFEFHHNDGRTKISISQKQYILDMLRKLKLHSINPASTPITQNYTCNLEEELKALSENSKDIEYVKNFPIREVLGMLQYLACCTRPDIQYAVNMLSRYSNSPTKSVCLQILHILRYLKGTLEYKLEYNGDNDFRTYAFCDADFAGDPNTRRSTTGYATYIGDSVISWYSSAQTGVTLSTCEAEYVALCSCTQEIVWLRMLLNEIGITQDQPTLVYEDNQSCIALANNPVYHKRTKHVDIKYHYTREKVEDGTIVLEHCDTEKQVADIFTKALGKNKVGDFCPTLLGKGFTRKRSGVIENTMN